MKIQKTIDDGPGELDIVFNVLRRESNIHLDFTFNGVKLPVDIWTISGRGDPEVLGIEGSVLQNRHNGYRYHNFKATYYRRTRKGRAEFETKCHECGSEVNEYGVCPKCDPCPHCHRPECQPRLSCVKKPQCRCGQPATLQRSDGEKMCSDCAREHVGTYIQIMS